MPDFREIKFTKTEDRILDVLDDGLPHQAWELIQAIDSEADAKLLGVHLTAIRKKLRVGGQDIICENNYNRVCYRHVVLICSPED